MSHENFKKDRAGCYSISDHRGVLIAQIFLWTSKWEGQMLYMLQILMCKGNGQTFTDANIYMGTVAREYDNVDYIICFSREIQKKVKHGLGRAILICQPDNLVDDHPDVKQRIKIPDMDVENIIAKTRSYLDSELKKIYAFMQGSHSILTKTTWLMPLLCCIR